MSGWSLMVEGDGGLGGRYLVWGAVVRSESMMQGRGEEELNEEDAGAPLMHGRAGEVIPRPNAACGTGKEDDV